MRIVFTYLGIILIISSIFRIPPFITALIYNEPVNSFLVSFFASILVGFIFLQIGDIGGLISRKQTDSLDLKSGLLLSALSFITISLLGSISYMFHFKGRFLDSFFESVSGFTTTGLTVFSSVADLPRSLLFYRAETQWIGGFGIVIVFIFMLLQISPSGKRIVRLRERTSSNIALYQAQGYASKIEPSMRESILKILGIYGIYTLLGIALLYLVGLNLFESITTAFTSLATGGFSVVDTFYTDNAQLAVISLLMILGATSFVMHNQLFKRRIKELTENNEFMFFIGVIVISTILGFLTFPNIKIVLFEMISAVTGTGFTIIDINKLPTIVIMLITFAMIIGGCSISTAGGIKMFRARQALTSVGWFIKKLMLPSRAVVPFKMRKKFVDEEVLLGTHIYISTYIIILFIGTLIFLFLGYSFLDSSFQITSALGTVGLNTTDIALVPALGKWVLIAAMFLGRLEIFPMLILVKKLFEWKKE